MNKKTMILLIPMLFLATCCYAETDKNVSSKIAAEKTPSEAEYWVIRSQALTELIPFLTIMRTEARNYYNMLTDYLEHIGKGEEFLKSGIKGSDSPAEYVKAMGNAEAFAEENVELPEKPMTWDQIVELAMEFVRQEGHIPTDVEGAEEIDMIKKICQQKRKHGIKVRDELREIAQNCMDIKAYLDSIDQYDAFLKYAPYKKAQEEEARKERMQKNREKLVAKGRARREQEKQNIWQERQNRLKNSYYRGRYYRGRYDRGRYRR